MEGANFMQEVDYEDTLAGRYKKKQTEKFFSVAPPRKLETKMRDVKKNYRVFEKYHTQLDNDMWNSFKKAFEDFNVFPVTITASKKIDYISIAVFDKDLTKLDDNGKNRLLKKGSFEISEYYDIDKRELNGPQVFIALPTGSSSYHCQYDVTIMEDKKLILVEEIRYSTMDKEESIVNEVEAETEEEMQYKQHTEVYQRKILENENKPIDEGNEYHFYEISWKGKPKKNLDINWRELGEGEYESLSSPHVRSPR